MKHPELRGSYEEIGRQQAAPLVGWQLASPESKLLRSAKHCEELIGLHAPELLDELRGLADYAGLEYDALLTLTTTVPFDPQEVPTSSCTVLAVSPERSPDGRPIVGKNYDYFHGVSDQAATTFRAFPNKHYASLGNCEIWMGRDDGINEAGLFVGIPKAFLPGLKPGLTFWFIARLLLDRCATVDEGLEPIHYLPHSASWSYLLADRFGSAVVVEPIIDGIEVRHPIDGLLVMTNHSVCAKWRGGEAFVPPDSHPRYDRIRELLGGADLVDAELVRHALRDHKGPVCSRGSTFPSAALAPSGPSSGGRASGNRRSR
jgi:hypothetical protein